MHLILPASTGDVNLCKLLLSAAALGYPTPTLIAWNQTFDTDYLLGRGSHVAKIRKVEEYLQGMNSSTNDDLLIMMDAFDIWFQLPLDVMVSRYLSINAQGQERIKERMGPAADAENIRQSIIFGAGKRCAPNQVHTIACYPIPPTPVPDDIYGGNTDTIMGRNKYTSLRQRFLNTGFVMGPIGDMRSLFTRAREKVDSWPHPDPEDNGSHGSDFMYHGSDQSVFNLILGEQEFQREVMRRRHAPTGSPNTVTRTTRRDTGQVNTIEGTVIGDDILNPPFTHQTMEHLPGKSCEFGIGLDYFSDLSHQTANAEFDGRWLRYNMSMEDIQTEAKDGRNEFDCPYRGNGQLAVDIARSKHPFAHLTNLKTTAAPDWQQTALYTNLCMDRIPVTIHHNGDKGAREYSWERLWLQPDAEALVEYLDKPGAHTDDGQYLGWNELCPSDYSAELFRNSPAV